MHSLPIGIYSMEISVTNDAFSRAPTWDCVKYLTAGKCKSHPYPSNDAA